MIVVVRHVMVVIWSVLRFGLATRNMALVVAVVGGLLLLAAAFSAQAAAPFVLYPFA